MVAQLSSANGPFMNLVQCCVQLCVVVADWKVLDSRARGVLHVLDCNVVIFS